MTDWKKTGFATRAIHVAQDPEKETGAVVKPIFQTSTYWQPEPGKHSGFEYSRTQNPTRQVLEECLASLEGANHGACFSSGMAAVTSLMLTLPPDIHVVCGNDVYGGTLRLFDKVLSDRRYSFDYASLSDVSAWKAAIKDNTKVFWLETPSNPMMELADIEALAQLAKAHKILLIVDNTFASPCLQQPISMGADAVLHSTTKYIGGHSDVIGGFVGLNDASWAEKLYFIQNSAGAVPGPFDAWLTTRGLKTLELRMQKHSENALSIAEHLEGHPKVQKVIYPGLKSHPQHQLAKKQMKDFGGMISLYLNADLLQCKQFLSKLEVFFLAESLGGVESLAEHPAIMTHASVSAKKRAALGIGDNFIRLSVGIENVEDLIADLEQALAQI